MVRMLRQLHLPVAVMVSVVVLLPWLASATTLPLASTVTVANAVPGSVVVYDEASESYSLSQVSDSPNVYGVVTERPTIVLQTSSTSPSVTTQGVSDMLVDVSGGAIVRGMVLTTSATPGVARRALAADEYAFAIALEPYDADTPGLIAVEINPTKVQAARQAQAAAGEDEAATSPTWVRLAIATGVIIVGIAFLLWSFRAMFVSGITSIGRNPRAKQAVVLTTIAGVVLGVVLLVAVVLIALGILVLPITS